MNAEKTNSAEFDFGDGKGQVPAHKHTNGGGWVADTASVADSAYVGPDARVFGRARIRGEARVDGQSIVSENARVGGQSIVSENARISGAARVGGQSIVGGNAWVGGNARISGNENKEETLNKRKNMKEDKEETKEYITGIEVLLIAWQNAKKARVMAQNALITAEAAAKKAFWHEVEAEGKWRRANNDAE